MAEAAKVEELPTILQRSIPPRMLAAAVGPLCGFVLAAAISFLPDRQLSVRIDLRLDLRAALLLLAVPGALLTLYLLLSPELFTGDSSKGQEMPKASEDVAQAKSAQSGLGHAEGPVPDIAPGPLHPEATPQDLLPQAILRAVSVALSSIPNGSVTLPQWLRHAEDLEAVSRLQQEMAATSPALVHRIPAKLVDGQDSFWSSPAFTACGKLWSLRSGPVSTEKSEKPAARFFCLLPHGHNARLRCAVVFAKRPGEGFKEKRVHDWPSELSGHPWGPTLSAEELEMFKQVDGSILLMVHATSLGGADDDAVS